MGKLFVIAQREFAAMVATKAFAFTLVMMPLLMLGGLVLLPLMNEVGGRKERRILVADGSGLLFETIEKAANARNEQIRQAQENAEGKVQGDNPFLKAELWNFEAAEEAELSDQQRLELSDKVRDGKLYAFVEIPSELQDFASAERVKIAFVSQDAAISGARRWLEQMVKQHVRSERLTQLGINPETVAQANIPVNLEPTMPYEKSDDGEVEGKTGADTLVSTFLPFGVMMLMFLVIFLAAQPMLESAMEEKGARIAELLLGSVSSTTLMAGKLLGNVAGSFVVFAFYGIGGWFVLYHNDWSSHLPYTMLPWLIVFQVLGVLFFSSIFLTIGASVSELKEAQSLLLPVWLVLALPMMVWFAAVRDPNGIVPVSLSFFPPSAPLMMSLRLAVGQAMPVWHAPVSMIVMLASTLLVVKFAGRIYRASLLKSDSAKSFGQILKRLRTAE